MSEKYVIEKIESLSEDMKDLNNEMKQIVQTQAKLSNLIDSYNNILTNVTKLQDRVHAIELKIAGQSWVERAMWIAVSAGIAVFVKG